MQEHGNWSDESPETVEREFVLMPLFRRLRDRFRKAPAPAAAETSLPADTYLIYPEQLAHQSARVHNDESWLQAEAPATVAAEHHEFEETAQPDSRTVSPREAFSPAPADQDFASQQSVEYEPEPVRREAFAEAAPESSGFEHSAPMTLQEAVSEPIPFPQIAAEEPLADHSASTMEQQEAPAEPIPFPHAAAEAHAFEHSVAYTEHHEALPEPIPFPEPVAKAAPVLEKPRNRHEEPIAIPVHSQSESVEAANLRYVVQQGDLGMDRRQAAVREPRIQRKQITVTVPLVNWRAIRPNWVILRPALIYGAIGFLTCLLLFTIPAIRRPASTLLPGDKVEAHAPQATPVAMPVAQGFTLQPGKKGYTVNPAAASSAPPPAPSVRKPHASSRSSSEPQVIVHHYGSAQGTTQAAKVVQTGSGVKKYSDLD